MLLRWYGVLAIPGGAHALSMTPGPHIRRTWTLTSGVSGRSRPAYLDACVRRTWTHASRYVAITSPSNARRASSWVRRARHPWRGACAFDDPRPAHPAYLDACVRRTWTLASRYVAITSPSSARRASSWLRGARHPWRGACAFDDSRPAHPAYLDACVRRTWTHASRYVAITSPSSARRASSLLRGARHPWRGACAFDDSRPAHPCAGAITSPSSARRACGSGYRPRHWGLRFSANARGPSIMSSLLDIAATAG